MQDGVLKSAGGEHLFLYMNILQAMKILKEKGVKLQLVW